MQYGRIVCNARQLALQLTKSRCQGIDRINTLRYIAPSNIINSSASRSIHETKISTAALNQKSEKNGIVKRLLKKIYDKEKLIAVTAGYKMYEKIVDTLDYSTFFKDFNMPDTFFSWFLVTQLHIWMIMVRYMAEGEYGKVARNCLVEAMWNDVYIRISKLGEIADVIKKRSILDLSGQFNIAIISYDEGLMSHDRVLACAIWRTFFTLQCNNPEQVEKLVIYIRKQINLLDRIPSEHIFKLSAMHFTSISDITLSK